MIIEQEFEEADLVELERVFSKSMEVKSPGITKIIRICDFLSIVCMYILQYSDDRFNRYDFKRNYLVGHYRGNWDTECDGAEKAERENETHECREAKVCTTLYG